MSNSRQLIMTFNKMQKLTKLFNRFNMHRHISTAFIYNELSITASCKTYSVPVQSASHFSTSIVNSCSKAMSEGETRTFNLNYSDILEAQKNDSILIIDVREKEEIDETGKLPGSIHIPMADVTTTLMSLSEQDFKERFNKEKPSRDTKIILSCRSGKRSAIVQEELQKFGYENAYNYVGGWLDWESNQKV